MQGQLALSRIQVQFTQQLLADKLEGLLDGEIFLDSDDLRDLRGLLDHVRNSDALVILQSAGYNRSCHFVKLQHILILTWSFCRGVESAVSIKC